MLGKLAFLVKKPLKLERYLALQVATSIIIVTMALTALELFFTLVNELRFLGHGNYNLPQVFIYIVAALPSKLYLLFPWAALVGTLLGLTQLNKHSELTVMETSGLARSYIAKGAMLGVSMVLMVAFTLGEGVAPISDNFAINFKTKALSAGQGVITNYGIWLKKDNDFIKINSSEANGTLQGVTIYQLQEQALAQVIVAKRARPLALGWQLEDVTINQLQQDSVITSKMDSYFLEKLVDSELVDTMALKHPEYLSFVTLWKVIVAQKSSKLNANKFELAFYMKLFNPLLIITLSLLVVPLAFTKLRSFNLGANVSAGILFSFILHNALKVIPQLLVARGVGASLATILPILLLFTIACIRIRRI